MQYLRRYIAVAVAVVALATGIGASISVCVAASRTHGLSTFGDLKYPANFKHFDYVNASAPKGGRLAMIGPSGMLTFDTFNPFILKGDPAQGLDLIFDSLMQRAYDEPGSMYGLVAHSALVADDKLSATFYLRPEARFADGSPLTAADLVFTLSILKEKGRPDYALSLKDIVNAEALDPLTVRYNFQGQLARDLPLLVGGLPILSKTYYDSHLFDQTTLDQPLGSGPYAIQEFKQGTYINYKRRPDYWAKDLAVNVGRFNFDELRFDYYRDRGIELQAIKAGQIDFREEFTSRDWATAYDIPAVREGRLIKRLLPDASPSGAQGFFLNLRQEKFKDIRVRKALDLAFDFEWMNKNIFFSVYTRTESFFENSEMKASGLPSPEELVLLEPHRAKLSPDVFKEPYRPEPSDGSGQNRQNLRQAARLLEEAGWMGRDGKRMNANGEVLNVEFLLEEPTFLRVFGPYQKNLQSLGIETSARQVDAAQYERRVKQYEFDIIVKRYSMSLTPGIELRNYWGSEAADMFGTSNLAGIKNPVIDALIDKVIGATSRVELVTATRALDRVLRAEHCWVPNWYKASHALVFWNKLAWPAIKPKYHRGVIDTWWYDESKAATLAAN